MGMVLRGCDPDLGRTLAVKVLRPEHRDDPGMLRRFVEEAQITGQLQHPGVVPVYELGRFADGRPFFTMKLVRGQTLAELLAARANPGEGLERLLLVVEQVCQTIAYAHACGVIHRDLKPSNIMVGAFGEVQVMDWGLAKRLHPRAPDVPRSADAATLSRDWRPADGLETQAGLAVGTPAYMPPEQANGQGDRLDERADVFGLGALLCQVLTGQPPYVAASASEAYRLAADGDLRDALARLDGCGADTELVRLTKDCLQPEPADRPRDAGAVAERLAAYRAGVQERLRRAEREQAAAEARAADAQARARKERRRRRLATSVSYLVSLVAVVGLGYQHLDQPWRVEEQSGKNDDAIVELRKAIELDPQNAQAHAKLGLALYEKGRLDEAIKVYRKAIELGPTDAQVHNNLGNALRRQQNLAAAVTAYREAIRLQPDYAAAYNNLGVALRGQGKLAEAEAAFRQAIDLQPDFASAYSNLGVALREQGKLAEAVAAYHKAIDLQPDHVRRASALQPDDAKAHYNLGNALRAQGKVAEAEAAFRAAIRLQQDFPEAHLNLGIALRQQGKLAEAVAAYREALRLKKDFPEAHSNLGNALARQGKLAEAVAAHREALRLDPNDAKAHSNLAELYRATGDSAKAFPLYVRALDLTKAARGENHPDYAASLNNLAELYKHMGDSAKALPLLERARDITKKAFGERHPAYAASLNNLGNALLAQGDKEEAVATLREAIRLKPDYAEAHNNLGTALAEQKKLAEAVAAFRRAVEADPKLAKAHNNLGAALKAQGDLDGAVSAFRRAIDADPKLTQAHLGLGQALLSQARFPEAAEATRRGLGLLPDDHPLCPAATQQLRRCERLAALDARLPAVLVGTASALSAAERLELAWLCRQPGRQLYAASARFYTTAFTEQPRLASDLHLKHRYDAACAAALAGCGKGKDTSKLDDGERARLRKQALAWLEADLAAWAKARALAAVSSPTALAEVNRTLEGWRTDPALAGVRGAGALSKLPAAERAAWRKLWADLDALSSDPGRRRGSE
jgi:tetratricopeptide (TPR) repeat protein